MTQRVKPSEKYGRLLTAARDVVAAQDDVISGWLQATRTLSPRDATVMDERQDALRLAINRLRRVLRDIDPEAPESREE